MKSSSYQNRVGTIQMGGICFTVERRDIALNQLASAYDLNELGDDVEIQACSTHLFNTYLTKILMATSPG